MNEKIITISRESQNLAMFLSIIFFVTSLFFTIFWYFCQTFFMLLYMFCTLIVNVIYYTLTLYWHEQNEHKIREMNEARARLQSKSSWMQRMKIFR